MFLIYNFKVMDLWLKFRLCVNKVLSVYLLYPMQVYNLKSVPEQVPQNVGIL